MEIAIKGAVIVRDDAKNNYVEYKQKCENCGWFSSSTSGHSITGSTVRTFFTCPKCYKQQEVVFNR